MKENDFKATMKDTFISKGFAFEKGKKYFVEQDEHYIYLLDNNNKEHAVSYEDASKYIESV